MGTMNRNRVLPGPQSWGDKRLLLQDWGPREVNSDDKPYTISNI